MFKIILFVIIGTIASIVVFNAIDANSSNTSTSNTTTDTSGTNVTNENLLTVSISGEVTKPGTYLIAENGTLGDLIVAAGNTTNNADANAYDTTYLLANNLSFYIAPLYDNGDTCSASPIEKININTASSEEILSFKNFTVTSNVANNVVSYRSSKGSFKRIEELKDVSYIGSATFEKMKNYVTIK